MNAERLLAHFEQISEAPDAVARLRRFILDLAVRGKLVEQDPGEEDQSARGRLSRFAESYPLIPGSWLYVPLASLLDEDTRNGYSRKPDDAKDGFPILRISAGTARADGLVEEDEFKLISGIDDDLASQYTVKKGDLLACRFNGNKAYVGRLSLFTGYSGRQFIYPDKLIRVRISEWLAEPSFIRWISSADLVRKEIEEKCATTVGNWGISAGKLKTCRLPLPPLAEQHRIVAKVDELMSLCDDLAAAREQREQCRERLAAANLQRLNQPSDDPDAFRSDARFALQVLPSITTTLTQIKGWRQTILNMAVRGKLVAQDPEDQPAEELINEITLEKALLERTGVIKSRKRSTRNSETTSNFRPPRGWELTSLGAIAYKITDGAHKTPTYVSKGVPFISVKDFSAGSLNFSHARFIPVEEHRLLYARCDPRRGDILLARIGTLGKAVLVETDIEFSLFVSVGLIRFDHRFIEPRYLCNLLNSPFVESEFDRIKIGGGTHTNKLNLGDLHSVAIPLPPLAEQHRIVAKVDELMALCTLLDQQLIQADQQRRRLLEALLTEALGGRLDAEEESHADAA
jgi:type I restriction enzyme S subunit